jgi:replicative DNA helicase
MSEPRADVDAERLLLGAVLTGRDIAPLARIVAPEDFWQPRHEAIWSAMLRVAESGTAIDIASVRHELDHAGAQVDPLYVAEIYGAASITDAGPFHAKRVADEARARRLVEAGHRIALAGEARNLGIDEAHDVARRALEDAIGKQRDGTLARLGDTLAEVIDIAEGGAVPALSTPWPDIDRMITGIAPGRLVVVGARPGVGKSLMGTNLALHMARRHDHAALIVSAEMPRIEVTQRMVAALAGVNLTELSAGKLDERQWDRVRHHYDTVNSLPVFVDDSSSPTVTSVRASVKEARRQRDDLALIVVDYLQLMSAPEVGRGASRVQQLGEISRGLKVIARETNTCVVAMAQVNREGVKSGARPTMSDLRESGSIEADADQVILLHRPDDRLPEVEVLVDKNRWGIRGQAKLLMAGHYARLESVEWRPSSAGELA